MSFHPRRKDTPRTVTGRVLAILGAFLPDRVELSLTEISRLAGLPYSTTHRLVSELTAWGMLERVGGFRYRIGQRMRDLAALAVTA